MKQNNDFTALFKLFNECKKQLPILAEELEAADHYTKFSFEQRDDEEPETRLNVHLSFGQYGNYSCGSYVSLSHPYSEAETTLREYHATWKKEQAQRDEAKRVAAEKDRIYQEYLAKK